MPHMAHAARSSMQCLLMQRAPVCNLSLHAPGTLMQHAPPCNTPLHATRTSMQHAPCNACLCNVFLSLHAPRTLMQRAHLYARAQVRTVAAFTAEPRACDRYEQRLQDPLKGSYLFGLINGVCTGGVNAIMYWTYALAFVYGAWRVSTGDYTGGTWALGWGRGEWSVECGGSACEFCRGLGVWTSCR